MELKKTDTFYIQYIRAFAFLENVDEDNFTSFYRIASLTLVEWVRLAKLLLSSEN